MFLSRLSNCASSITTTAVGFTEALTAVTDGVVVGAGLLRKEDGPVKLPLLLSFDLC